jgi:hypothetical protein
MYICFRKDNKAFLDSTSLRVGATQEQNDKALAMHFNTIKEKYGLDEDQVVSFFLNEADARRFMDGHEYDLGFSGDEIVSISFERDDNMGWVSVVSSAANNKLLHEVIDGVPVIEDSTLTFTIYDKDMNVDVSYNGVIKVPISSSFGESVVADVTISNGIATIPFYPSKVCEYRIFNPGQKRLFAEKLKLTTPILIDVHTEGEVRI